MVLLFEHGFSGRGNFCKAFAGAQVNLSYHEWRTPSRKTTFLSKIVVIFVDFVLISAEMITHLNKMRIAHFGLLIQQILVIWTRLPS